MKPFIVLTTCLALSVGIASAEKAKEGGGKGGKHAAAPKGGGAHPQHTGGQGGGKHANVNHEGHNATHGNGAHTGKGPHNKQLNGKGTGVAGEHAAAGGGAGKAQIKHYNFANVHNTNIKSVTFKENNRIIGAENWHGEHYAVFHDYHAVWHEHGWWVEHYPRVVLIGGGWYYWNAGFWFPAWGYAPTASFYAYDGPIYGYHGLNPDQVVANAQEQLQTQGYYHGDVDGMLGPLTRAALADYQRDHGLTETAAIDQPTMEALGFTEETTEASG
jgi:hypothetical protein